MRMRLRQGLMLAVPAGYNFLHSCPTAIALHFAACSTWPGRSSTAQPSSSPPSDMSAAPWSQSPTRLVCETYSQNTPLASTRHCQAFYISVRASSVVTRTFHQMPAARPRVIPMTISLVTDTREAWPLVVKLEAARMTDCPAIVAHWGQHSVLKCSSEMRTIADRLPHKPKVEN